MYSPLMAVPRDTRIASVAIAIPPNSRPQCIGRFPRPNFASLLLARRLSDDDKLLGDIVADSNAYLAGSLPRQFRTRYFFIMDSDVEFDLMMSRAAVRGMRVAPGVFQGSREYLGHRNRGGHSASSQNTLHLLVRPQVSTALSIFSLSNVSTEAWGRVGKIKIVPLFQLVAVATLRVQDAPISSVVDRPAN